MKNWFSQLKVLNSARYDCLSALLLIGFLPIFLMALFIEIDTPRNTILIIGHPKILIAGLFLYAVAVVVLSYKYSGKLMKFLYEIECGLQNVIDGKNYQPKLVAIPKEFQMIFEHMQKITNIFNLLLAHQQQSTVENLSDHRLENVNLKNENIAEILQSIIKNDMPHISENADSLMHAINSFRLLFQKLLNQLALLNHQSLEHKSLLNYVDEPIAKLSELIASTSVYAKNSSGIVLRAANAVEETEFNLEKFNADSSKVIDALSFIQGVANQIHLLSLNAAIESSRADVSGKGFSIVAVEMKNLANKAIQATNDMSIHFNGLQNTSVGAVKSIKDVIDLIADLKLQSADINENINKQKLVNMQIFDFYNNLNTNHECAEQNILLVSEEIQKIHDWCNNINLLGQNIQGHNQAVFAELKSLSNF